METGHVDMETGHVDMARISDGTLFLTFNEPLQHP